MVNVALAYNWTQFHEWFRGEVQLRRKMGVREAAAWLDLGASSVGKYLDGRQTPKNIEVITKISEKTGRSIAEIFDMTRQQAGAKESSAPLEVELRHEIRMLRDDLARQQRLLEDVWRALEVKAERQVPLPSGGGKPDG